MINGLFWDHTVPHPDSASAPANTHRAKASVPRYPLYLCFPSMPALHGAIPIACSCALRATRFDTFGVSR